MDMQKCKKALPPRQRGRESVWSAIVSSWRDQTSLPLSGTRQETPPGMKAYGHWTNSRAFFRRRPIVQRRGFCVKRGPVRVGKI